MACSKHVLVSMAKLLTRGLLFSFPLLMTANSSAFSQEHAPAEPSVSVILKATSDRYSDFKTVGDLTKLLTAILKSPDDQQFLKTYTAKIKLDEKLPQVAVKGNEISFKEIPSGRVTTLKVLDIMNDTYLVRGRTLTLGPSRAMKDQVEDITNALNPASANRSPSLRDLFVPQANADDSYTSLAISILWGGLVNSNNVARQKWNQVLDTANQALAACKELKQSPFWKKFDGPDELTSEKKLKSAQSKICSHYDPSMAGIALPENYSDRDACAATKSTVNCLNKQKGNKIETPSVAAFITKVDNLSDLMNSAYFTKEGGKPAKNPNQPAGTTP